MTLNQIVDLLNDKELLNNPRDFIFAAEFLNLETKIQAGQFQLTSGLSNFDLLHQLQDAGRAANFVTIPEGFTTRQIASRLQKEIGLDSTDFMDCIEDTKLLNKYGLDTPTFEGFLFPDSYNFYPDMTCQEILDQMVYRFFEVFDSSMQVKAEQCGLSMIEAVTLASIIQGEMQDQSEAPLISAVYHNRLKRRMRLQADPTIQYIIRNGPRRLYNGDLEIDSPYNTYKHYGLPPGPVSNPGKTALEAAVSPAHMSYLYMVAQGNGKHAFSNSLTDHLKAKTHLDSLRRALARNKNKPR